MEPILDKIAKAPLAAKFGGAVGIVVVLTALNYFLVIDPLESNIVRQQGTLSKLKLDLAEKEGIAQNLNEKRREMDRLEQELQAALTKMPEAKEIEELLEQLNDLGKKSGLQISSLTPGGEANAGFYSRIPIQISVKGNFHEIGMFLQNVANMRRIVNVSSIKLRTPTMANNKVVLESEFTATTFRFLAQSPN